MHRLAVYGTLKQGSYNHEYYMPEAVPRGVEVVRGYDMYDLGDFPYVVASDYPDANISVEVYELPDTVAQAIRNMELSAGYAAVNIQTRWGTAEMFVYTPEKHDRNFKFNPDWAENRVPSGNWPVVTEERYQI